MPSTTRPPRSGVKTTLALLLFLGITSAAPPARAEVLVIASLVEALLMVGATGMGGYLLGQTGKGAELANYIFRRPQPERLPDQAAQAEALASQDAEWDRLVRYGKAQFCRSPGDDGCAAESGW